ncbi:MAG: hypothetical protein ACUVXI_12190 [bacterium]
MFKGQPCPICDNKLRWIEADAFACAEGHLFRCEIPDILSRSEEVVLIHLMPTEIGDVKKILRNGLYEFGNRYRYLRDSSGNLIPQRD